MRTNKDYKDNICPRCGNIIFFPALSRIDNYTKICSDCGTEEAVIDFHFLSSLDETDIETLGVIIDVLAIHLRENKNNPVKSRHYNKIREQFLRRRTKLLDELEEGGEKVK